MQICLSPGRETEFIWSGLIVVLFIKIDHVILEMQFSALSKHLA